VTRIATPALDVRDLELVLALAGAGTTVRAASSLHLTQSAVSRGLLAVEDKLGTRLFHRTPRGLAPTPAGQRLVDGAGTVLARLVELEAETRAPATAPIRLRLVCECYTAYRWLPSALAELQRAAGNIELTLAFEHTREPVDALMDGSIDVALLTTARVARTLIEQPLFADEIVFVVARTHPLAAQPAITPDDLRAYPLIGSTNTPEPEARWFASRVFGRTAPKLARLQFPLTEAVIDAARAGMGVAVMSEWIASGYLGGGDLVAKRLRGRPLRRPWRIAYRREVSEAARRLAAVLASAVPHLG